MKYAKSFNDEGQLIFPGFSEQLQLVVEPWGDDAWARGAAGLMLEEVFSPTLYSHQAPGASTLAGSLSGR